MNNAAPICPKCQAPMIEGFVLDRTYGANDISKWVEGEPEKSWWAGTNISDKKLFEIKTFRCIRCGCLESYAN
jgi:hypothetical protein